MQEQTNYTAFQQGAIYQYVRNALVIHCPADSRTKAKAPLYCFCSVSMAAGINGQQASLFKRGDMKHLDGTFLWVEENDPRGDTLGSWEFQQNGARAEVGRVVYHRRDRPHSTATAALSVGPTAMRQIASGRDPAVLAFALSNDPMKFGNTPTMANGPHDVLFLANGFATSANPWVQSQFLSLTAAPSFRSARDCAR